MMTNDDLLVSIIDGVMALRESSIGDESAARIARLEAIDYEIWAMIDGDDA